MKKESVVKAEMPEPAVHPTAVVAPSAEIGRGVTVGAYAVIGPHVEIGEDCFVGSHAVIEGWTRIGPRCQIFQFASVGAAPQDFSYRGEETHLTIGSDNVFREFVTIHRATTKADRITVIGSHNYFMAYSHVAHDCRIADHVIMANSVALGGHILIESHAIIGGLSAIHQFTRVGSYAMIGGGSAVSQDVPPYLSVAGNRAKPFGLNLVGLRRHGFSEETIAKLKKAYKTVYREGLTLKEALERIMTEHGDAAEVRHFVEFVRGSERGICR